MKVKTKKENEKRNIKIGDLVKVTRPSIGIPRDTVGLVMSADFADSGFRYYKTKMIGVDMAARRFLGRDLEVVSEGR